MIVFELSSSALTKTWPNTKLDSPLPQTHLRFLAKLLYLSFFWLRSSPDGWFLASGLSTDSFAKIAGVPPSVRSVIVDLASVDIRPYLGVDKAEYGPGFFPDGSGFSFYSLEVMT